MFACMPRVLMIACIPPWPPIKTAVLDVRDVVGNKVVTQCITLVYGAPEFAGGGVDRQAYRVANTVGKDAHPRAVRIEFQNIGTIFLPRMGVGIIDVRG